MLKIFNNLKPFFEDNYRVINIREYARIVKISPPSASKLLKGYEKEGLLKSDKNRNYIDYRANSKSKLFMELSRIYWYFSFEKSGLVEFIEKNLLSPLIILFGSLNKAESKSDSDVDLAIFTPSKKTIDIKNFEKKIGRKVQIFMFKSQQDVKNKDLLNNILNGFIIKGGW